MREFYLVNEVGASYFFNAKSKALISNITDLGFTKDNKYLAYDNDYVLVESKNTQATLSFKVIFLKGYLGYSEFLLFIRRSSEIRFFYKIGENSKFCYVTLKSISKTELESNTIQSSVTFDMLSLWLVSENYTIRANEDGSGKVFPTIYPYYYSASHNGTITINNDGEIKAPLNMTITGAVNNPTVEIIKDGVALSTLKLLLYSPDCVIEISSIPKNQYMNLTEEGITTNIYSLQDFTCDNFLFLEKGEYQVRFTPGVTHDSTCRINIIKGYAGH